MTGMVARFVPLFLFSWLCTATVYASFDLSLFPQASTGRIQRHDPTAGVGLGGFSAPGVNNLALDQTNRRVFASTATSSRLRSYDYNNGDFLGMLELGAIPSQFSYNSLTNSVFFVAPGGVARRVNASTGTIDNIPGLIAGITWRTMMSAGNAVILVGTNSGNMVITQSFNATTLAFTDSLATGAIALPGTRMGKGVLVPTGSGFTFGFSFLNGSGAVQALYGPVASSGFINSISEVNLAGFSNVILPSAMPAHNGLFFLGSDSTVTSTMRVNGYSITGDLVSQSTAAGFAFADSNFGAVNIVAPEPGTLLALGAGAFALLRRRPKQ